MKVAVFALGLALLSLASPAYASWAENANMREPVYTGTAASLAQASHARAYPRHSVRRARASKLYR